MKTIQALVLAARPPRRTARVSALAGIALMAAGCANQQTVWRVEDTANKTASTTRRANALRQELKVD